MAVSIAPKETTDLNQMEDEAFRLLVDRTLSGLYRSGEIEEIYASWCGDPDETARAFFRNNALPE